MSAPIPGVGSGPPGWLLRVIRDQRVAFLVVGLVNTAIGFVAFFGFDDLFTACRPAFFDRFGPVGSDANAVAHNTLVLACAHVVTVLCAFVLYRTVVFRVRGHLWRDLARFEGVYLTSIAVNWLALNPLVVWLEMSPKVAQTLIVVFQAFFAWFAHKHFSFRRKPADPPGDGSPS